MKSLALALPLAVAPSETTVLSACAKAAKSEYTYAMDVLIAGQLLREYRVALQSSCHSGKSSAWHDGTKPEDAKFSNWIEANGIPSRTAYRWMECADRVSRLQLGLSMAVDYLPCIDVEGKAVALSHCMTAPEHSLTGKALQFRQSLLSFMEDKTLSEAMRAVADGESGGGRISRAGSGKSSRAGDGDRKAFDVFTQRKLANISTFLGHKLGVNQKAAIVTAFDAALQRWPRWLVEGLAEKCRTELKLNDADRAARTKF